MLFRSRRLVLPDDVDDDTMECILYLREEEWADINVGDKEVWCCEFLPEQAEVLFDGIEQVSRDSTMVRVGGISNEAFEKMGAKSGISVLKFKRTATTFVGEFVDDVSFESEVGIEFFEEELFDEDDDGLMIFEFPNNDRNNERRSLAEMQGSRVLASSQGELRVLVVRITAFDKKASLSVSPDDSRADLHDR